MNNKNINSLKLDKQYATIKDLLYKTNKKGKTSELNK